MEEQPSLLNNLICCIQVGSTLFTNNNKDIDLLCIFDDYADNNGEVISELKKKFPGFTDYLISNKLDIKYFYPNYYIAQLIKENKLSPIYGTFPLTPNPAEMLRLTINDSCFIPNLSYYERPDNIIKSFYHILLVYYFFKNNNTDLNDEERVEIQKAHDGEYLKSDAYKIKQQLINITSRIN